MTDALVGYTWQAVVHGRRVTLRIIGVGLTSYVVKNVEDLRANAVRIPKATLQAHLASVR